MKIEFLQAEEDIDQFVDFLYDTHFFIYRNSSTMQKSPMSKQAAKEVLLIDLLISGRNYCIGTDRNTMLFDFTSCGPRSHPRYTNRMGRDPGVICSNNNVCDLQIIDSIKKYFQKNYKLQRYHNTAKFRCWFGPNYQLMDSAYIRSPEQNYICPGYIHMTCAQHHSETACAHLSKILHTHPELSGVKILQRLWCDKAGVADVVAGFLIDRSQFGIECIVQIAKDLACQESRIRVVQEKNYEAVFSTWGEKDRNVTDWDMRISVAQEWKGFGNFCTPCTWLV